MSNNLTGEDNMLFFKIETFVINLVIIASTIATAAEILKLKLRHLNR